MNTTKPASIRVRSSVKAGAFGGNNHNGSVRTVGIRVRSSVKAGAFGGNNHNGSVRCAK